MWLVALGLGLVLLYTWLRGWWFAAVLVMLAIWFWDGLLHHDVAEIPFGRLGLEAIVAWAPFAIRQFVQKQRAKRSGRHVRSRPLLYARAVSESAQEHHAVNRRTKAVSGFSALAALNPTPGRLKPAQRQILAIHLRASSQLPVSAWMLERGEPVEPIMALVSILASWIVSTASALDLDLEHGIGMAQQGIADVAHSIAGPGKGESVH